VSVRAYESLEAAERDHPDAPIYQGEIEVKGG
jgi:hypothetical protein